MPVIMPAKTPLAFCLRVARPQLPSLPTRTFTSTHPFPSRTAPSLFIEKPLSRTVIRNYSRKPPTQPNPTSSLGSPEPQSFTARLRKLSREYGWTVIGVYLALTVADLPFCFLAVKYIGAERIAHAEHVVVGGAKDLIGRVFPNIFDKESETETEAQVAQTEKEEFLEGPSECLNQYFVARLMYTCQLSGQNSDWSSWFTNPSSSSESHSQQRSRRRW